MGSAPSSTRSRRVTFDDEDARRDVIEEYTEESYPQPTRGPATTTTTFERTYTDQDSFELGDPRQSRSRESTFSLGQRIKKKAEDDERTVDRIIKEHHIVHPDTVGHKTATDRRVPSSGRVVTKTITEREMFDGSISSDGMLRGGRQLRAIEERPSKPTMSENLWTTGGRRYYEAEHRDNWSNDDETRLQLTTHGRSTLRANNGVKVLSGEVLKPIETTTVVDKERIDERRPHHYRVVTAHRDTANPSPSTRYYRVRKKGGSLSVASSTSSLVSERTISEPGQRSARYSRYYPVDRRSRRRHHNDDNDVVERVIIHRHIRAPREQEPDVKVTRHRERRTSGNPRVVYEDERSGDDDDSGYRGQSPRRRRDDYGEKEYRWTTSVRRPNDRKFVTRYEYD
jgi:hypothetical protein